jgi:MFS family permease
MEHTAAMVSTQTTHVRYIIVLMLLAARAFSYGDRVVLSIAATDIGRNLHLHALRLGYLFSAFSWAYAAAQLPAGSLLDLLWLQARLRDQHRWLVVLRVSFRLCRVCPGGGGFLHYFLPCGLSPNWLNRPFSRVTDASWPRGFLPPRVAAPLRSSIHRSTFRW